MKNFIVTIFAHGSASYSVNAKDEEEAKSLASEMADLDDVEVADWDIELEPEVEEQ